MNELDRLIDALDELHAALLAGGTRPAREAPVLPVRELPAVPRGTRDPRLCAARALEAFRRAGLDTAPDTSAPQDEEAPPPGRDREQLVAAVERASRALKREGGDRTSHARPVMELAAIFDGESAAIAILRELGFPSTRVPKFETAYAFWLAVCRELDNGVVRGGCDALLELAARKYPANVKLASWRAPTPDQGDPRVTSGATRPESGAPLEPAALASLGAALRRLVGDCAERARVRALLDAGSGSHDGWLAAHLASCASCRAWIDAELARPLPEAARAALEAARARELPCPDDAVLAGRSHPPEVEEHLLACPACRARRLDASRAGARELAAGARAGAARRVRPVERLDLTARPFSLAAAGAEAGDAEAQRAAPPRAAEALLVASGYEVRALGGGLFRLRRIGGGEAAPGEARDSQGASRPASGAAALGGARPSADGLFDGPAVLVASLPGREDVRFELALEAGGFELDEAEESAVRGLVAAGASFRFEATT